MLIHSPIHSPDQSSSQGTPLHTWKNQPLLLHKHGGQHQEREYNDYYLLYQRHCWDYLSMDKLGSTLDTIKKIYTIRFRDVVEHVVGNK